MIVLQVIGVVFIFTSAAVLIPRLHVKAEYGDDRSEIGIRWGWLKLRFSLRDSLFSGSFLFYIFPREKKPETTPVDDRSDRAGFPPHPAQTSPETEVVDPEKIDRSTEPTPPDTETYDSSAEDDSTFKAPRKNNFKIPRISFVRKPRSTKSDIPTIDEDIDKYFWLKFVWRERELAAEIVKGFIRSSRRIISRIRTDYCNIDLSLGTGDPMTTALAVGSLESSLWMLRRYGRLDIVPLYEVRQLDLDLSCSFSVRPYQVVYIVMWHLLTLPWVRIVRVGWEVRRGVSST